MADALNRGPGRPVDEQSVAELVQRASEQITKLVRDELGLDWHVHLFRHFAGERYLDAYQGDLDGVANLLGHGGTAAARGVDRRPRAWAGSGRGRSGCAGSSGA